MTSMHVPDPVVSLALIPKERNQPNFGKALGRFVKEDPTFRVHTDEESSQTIISGMGELHLQIYVERMKREYNCECTTGQPKARGPPPHTTPTPLEQRPRPSHNLSLIHI